MKTETITIYNFNELSPEAKQKALDDNRYWNVDGLDWWDGVYGNVKDAAKMLGIEIDDIYYSGFYSQGDGAKFTGRYSYQAGAIKAIKKEFPQWAELHQIAQDLQEIQCPYFYMLEAHVSSSGNYCHEYATAIEVFDTESRYRDINDAEQSLQDTLRDFMRLIYSSLEAEHDYLMSDESIAESLEVNGVEFLEDGTRY